MILAIAGCVIVVLLACLFLMDRRARRQGHKARTAAEMDEMTREGRRDARAIDNSLLGTLDEDRSWTEFSRRTGKGREDPPA